ncbi:MAG: DUF4132 domain-containing protein [Micropruina sp.]|uniref:DUF4132 domain-containing protein n=1 Tax=Micropruina sp. TaxID=2737536 RepID=UPI0039E50A81
MFERLKSALTGQPAGPHPQLREALAPFRAVSDQLFDRAVAYVYDGSGPDVLLELDAAHQPDLDGLMARPAMVMAGRPGIPDPLKQRLKQIGVRGEPRVTLTNARAQLYRTNAVTQLQFLRFGYLLAALGTGPNRRVDGVPAWLTALLNDLASVTGRETLPHLQWPPERFADLLRHDGHPEADIPTTVFLAMWQQEKTWGSVQLRPHDLPGIDNYLLGFGHLIVPSAIARLTADARTALPQRVEQNPQVAVALAPLIAQLTVDKAKGVRVAAVAALPRLPGDVQAAVLRPVLLSASESAARELIEYLSRTSAGGALLDEAVAAGAKLGAAAQKANARREVVQAAAAQERQLVLPSFIPFPDEVDEPRALDELRRLLATLIARVEGTDHAWNNRRLKELQQISEADLRQIVAAAAGRQRPPAIIERFSYPALAQGVRCFNVVHLLRLQQPTRHVRLDWALQLRADEVTDLRQVEDAVRRTWNTREAVEYVPQLARQSWWLTVEPEAAWPWFAGRLDVLQNWLTASAADTGDALAILDAFPALPAALLPSIAAVAVGDSRRNRPPAQAVLAKHGLARELAEQGLTDGRGEIRAVSASWLAKAGETGSVPALRTALAKEKREVPRAAMLNALRDLGDDISADLAPEKLLAEAKKGLRAKLPATLDWFDFDRLPALRWADGTGADGTEVDPMIPTWWVVLANKAKDPDGSGLLDLYLGQLDPASGEALGRFVLTSWIAQDTRHPTEEESRVHAQAEGQRRYAWAQNNLKRVQSTPNPPHADWARQAAAVPLEQHVRAAYTLHQGTYFGSASANRGLLALTTRMPGIELANAVQSYIRNHGARRAQVDALMYPLYANGQPAAVQLLLSIARRFKQASVQATAAKLVESLADKRGWTADELADRTIPAAGFDADALLRLDFGSRTFLGRATPSGTIALSTADGKPIKSLPAARADDDAELVKEAKKQLTTSRKELKAVLTQQTARLYEAMCAERAWAAADWREFLLEHPLVGQLVSRLVWLENPGPAQRAFRPTEDGSLIDADDDTVELAPDARVALAHRVRIGDDAAGAWKAHLADYEVTPLFAQFDNAVPDIDRNATQTRDLQGHLTDTFSFRGVATKRGYQRGPAEDGAWFDEYTKQFSSVGLTAVLEFTGSYVPEENFACATVGLGFRAGRRGNVRLSAVPDVLLAECYADYAALAALGPFDPQWEKKAGI